MKLVFDFDGTLVDVSTRDWLVYKVALGSDKALPKQEFAELRRQHVPIQSIVKRTVPDAAEELIQGFLSRRLELIEAEEMVQHDVPVPLLVETLSAFVDRRHELHVLSARFNRPTLIRQLASLDVLRFFSSVNVTSGTEHKASALKGLISDPDDCVMFGDTEHDILAARSNSVRSVAVLTGIRTEEELRLLNPTVIVENIAASVDTIDAWSLRTNSR